MRLRAGSHRLWAIGSAAMLALALALPARGEDTPADQARTQMLDIVPDYAKILRDQWTTTVRPERFEREAGHYGLLTDTGAPRRITLEESIALALEHNTGLRVQKLSPIAATARVREAYAQFDPAAYGNSAKTRSDVPVTSISVFTNAGATDIFNQEVDWNVGLRKELLTGARVNLQWTNARLTSPPTVINPVQPEYVSTLGISLAQPLLRDFGWRFALLVVDVAQLAEEQAFYDYKAQVANLVATVEQAYWTYVLAIENVRVEDKGLELAKELLRQNQGRFKVGALPQTAVLESEAEVARREANLVRARALQRIARDNLRALLNAREDEGDALLMIEPADAPTVVPVELDLDRSLEAAYKDRPELVSARLNADGRKVERKIAENRLLPRLDVVGAVGLNGIGGNNSGLLPQPPAMPPPTPNPFAFYVNPGVLGGYGRSLELLTDGRYYQYQFGAVVEVPLGNADAKARYAEAKVNSEAARLSLAQLEETVTLEITQSVNNLKALLKGIEATRIARELAAENVRNQQARYDVGLATTKDLIDFQDRLTQAERAEIESLTTYNIEVARLRRADGSLLHDRSVLLERAQPEPPPWWARF
jgi:outer membrane protein